MALSLTASQKSLRSLFINDDRYIIPPFQRSYSWTKKEVNQLYEDITMAYYQGNEYFLGNIVIANSNQMDAYPHLIDGQQRMITLWIIIKVLHTLTGNSKLAKMLKIEDDNDLPVSKIRSDVYEGLDQSNIDELLNWKKEDFNKSSRVLASLPVVMSNAVLIYRLFEEYFGRLDKEEQENFVSYFINKVFLNSSLKNQYIG